jgi:hypothetical protein
MIRDTERRIEFAEIHREELLSTKVGRAAQAKFMTMLNKKTEAEKLAMRFKVRPETNYWLVGPYPPSKLPIPPVPKTETEAEIRAFPASLRLKPQQQRLAQMHKDSLRLPHKARLPPAAPVACLDCPTNEALAQLKRSMARCRQEYDLDN